MSRTARPSSTSSLACLLLVAVSGLALNASADITLSMPGTLQVDSNPPQIFNKPDAVALATDNGSKDYAYVPQSAHVKHWEFLPDAGWPVWLHKDIKTGAISGAPQIKDLGSYCGLSINGYNLAAKPVSKASTGQFCIEVRDVYTPVLTGAPPKTVFSGDPYSFKPVVAHAYGPLSVTNLPNWILPGNVNLNTGEIHAIAGAPGQYNGIIVMTASNPNAAKGGNGVTTAKLGPFDVTVLAKPIAPPNSGKLDSNVSTFGPKQPCSSPIEANDHCVNVKFNVKNLSCTGTATYEIIQTPQGKDGKCIRRGGGFAYLGGNTCDGASTGTGCRMSYSVSPQCSAPKESPINVTRNFQVILKCDGKTLDNAFGSDDTLK